jgi:hypothetical protein
MNEHPAIISSSLQGTTIFPLFSRVHYMADYFLRAIAFQWLSLIAKMRAEIDPKLLIRVAFHHLLKTTRAKLWDIIIYLTNTDLSFLVPQYRLERSSD